MFKFVNTSTTGILTTFGKFNKTLQPGLNIYIPLIQKVHIVSNKLNENTFNFEIKTKPLIISFTLKR